MKWDLFTDLVQARFNEIRLTAVDGLVYCPPEPSDLREFLVESAEDDDDLSAVDYMGPLELLSAEFETHPLLEFLWGGFGPTSSFAGIEVADLGEVGALAFWQTEIPPEVAFALVRPGDAAEAWSALVDRLLPDNGGSFGIGLFGSLPSETTNRRPGLVPATVVKEGYRRWLEWADEEGWGQWGSLRDEMLARLEDPNPLSRSSRLLEKLARLGPKGYLDAARPDGSHLSESDRRLILDNYFDLTYR